MNCPRGNVGRFSCPLGRNHAEDFQRKDAKVQRLNAAKPQPKRLPLLHRRRGPGRGGAFVFLGWPLSSILSPRRRSGERKKNGRAKKSSRLARIWTDSSAKASFAGRLGAGAAVRNLQSAICNLKSSEAWSQPVSAHTSARVSIPHSRDWRPAWSRKIGSPVAATCSRRLSEFMNTCRAECFSQRKRMVDRAGILDSQLAGHDG